MTNALATLNTLAADELISLAKSIRLWQEQRGLSDNELLRKMPDLGSTKTFTRLLKGDTAELDLERWIANYRAVAAAIESMASGEQEEEELYDDFSTIAALRRALVEILQDRSIRRVICYEAESGEGKSSALTLLQQKYGSRILRVECFAAWDDNPNAFLGAILEALGVKELAISREGRLRQVITKLKMTRRALALDEAHHLGPNCLNTCKALVNQTPGELILLALPTLWRRLERSSYEEVKQLLGNRLAERLKSAGIQPADVKKMLSRRANVSDEASVALVHKEALKRGNFSFVASVCKRLAMQKPDGQPSFEDVTAAVAIVMARRPAVS